MYWDIVRALPLRSREALRAELSTQRLFDIMSTEACLAKVRERVDGTVGIVELDGRLTVNDYPGLLKEAVAGVVRRGAKNVLVDLSGVHYIDSTRLGELIAAHVTVSRQGGRLKLLRTPARVVELLALAGLGDVFERFDSIEEAKRSFS
jgi:anti-sigma B factor antagonist